MTENSSFFVGILVGVVLSLVTVFSFNKYFTSFEHDRRVEETTTQTRKDDKSNSDSDSLVMRESEFSSDWFTSANNFNLETRAIFSKSWIFLTHASRFSKPGDYHSFTTCGFAIFLILGKDHKIRAFHNVCRHRAYTVTRKESGSSTVLGCKYHGWSYDAKGRLVKAPMFDSVPGFRKEDNGLFEIPLRVSEGSGAVWINLDAARTSTGKDDTIEKQEKDFENYMFKKSIRNKCRWLGGRTVEGGFNWKSAVDTEVFNIGEPSLPTLSLLDFWWRSKSQVSDLHLFPCSMIYKVPNTDLWYSIVLMPTSSSKTQIRWDLYCNSARSNHAVEKAITSQIEGMISTQAKDLESSPQVVNDRNQEIQREILVHLKAHSRVERTLGKEVTPAMTKAKTSDKFLQAEILCKELDCFGDGARNVNSTKRQDILAW